MVKRLLIANAAVYLVQLLSEAQGFPFTQLFALNPHLVVHSGHFWQPFTYMWLHGSVLHILFNMLWLWMFGGMLEAAWGSQRFLRFYLQCGIGAGFVILVWNLVLDPVSYTLGASGAVYGLLAAFSLMWPDRTIMLIFPPVPIRAIWFVPVVFAMDFVLSSGRANVSYIGHVGGVLVAAFILRDSLSRYVGPAALRHRWHRWRMRSRLRAVRRDEWQKRRDDRFR
jgi:membrane associated rhomboid family serine protease